MGYRRGRGRRKCRRQHERCCYARRRRPAVVEDPITLERIASEPGRSRVWPSDTDRFGPRREGEEPKPPMNGREKSHPAVVAMNPANKAANSAAEPAEPRAGTKGNADQQSTLRTQGRVRVTQALDRIRQVANAQRALRRQPPEVGTVCGKAARTDLRGGRPAMGVPTAITLATRILTYQGRRASFSH